MSPLQARVCGHSAPVLDVKWDPFNDLRLASCSEDCTVSFNGNLFRCAVHMVSMTTAVVCVCVQVKVWDIPPNGLKDDLVEPSKDLTAHSRRVSIIEWHPTARDLLLSSAYDCRV